ncbi:MAG: phosphoglucosamine mutase [Anaerohalosphaeraceae bacterium]|nr:phosphoglucosamine mutase [Anaerohalosphaeraceae bacterium]
MTEELIISISGMRGIIGENLNASIAAEYGCGFGSFLKSAGESSQDSQRISVALGRDSRPSGQMMASAISAGLSSVGVDVIDLGIVTTPTVGIVLRHLGCAGGVVITASHNPIEFNGIKLLLADGIAPSAAKAEQIKKIYFDKNFAPVGSVDCGTITAYQNPDAVHLEKVLACVDAEAIAKCKFKVVLDSVNGAGARPAISLLTALGCEIIAINPEPTGLFAHTPEPTAENLTGLCQEVLSASADVGFAQDPDADRLAIVDGDGKYIGEEYTLALAAKYIFSHSKGTAAANLSTSRMLDDIVSDAGCTVLRTAVGEANVAEAMVKNNCVIGGEGNGGLIDLRVGPVRDSLIAMAIVLQLACETGKTIAQLVADIEPYEMSKEKFAAGPAQASEIIDLAKEAFSDAEVNTIDGCRIDFDSGWIHLRTSNTEPVMRLISEFKKGSQWQSYIDTVKEICKKVIG